MKYILASVAVLPLILNSALSQQSDAVTKWSPFISAGYASAAPSSVHKYYDLVIGSYRSKGVFISTQTPFGPSFGASAGILMSKLERVSFGFAAGYWFSPSYSIYEDYAGTLKVNGSVSSFDICIRVNCRLSTIAGFPVDLSVLPGVTHASASVTEDLAFKASPDLDYHARTTASKWGPSFEAALGSSTRIGLFTVALEFGYRFSWNTVRRETVESTSGNGYIDESWDISQSGFVVLVTTSVTL